jgi:hypothetical protein
MSDVDALRDKMFDMYEFYKTSGVDMNDLTIWDLFTNIVPESDAKMTMLLKADLPLLELLVGGQTIGQVARTLGISQAAVAKVAELWNINVSLKTLDINPLFLYNDDMRFDEFAEDFSDSSLRSYSKKELQDYFDNVLTYVGLIEFLREVE